MSILGMNHDCSKEKEYEDEIYFKKLQINVKI